MGKEGGRGWSREGSDGTRMAVGRSVMGLGREGDEARKGERMGLGRERGWGWEEGGMGTKWGGK